MTRKDSQQQSWRRPPVRAALLLLAAVALVLGAGCAEEPEPVEVAQVSKVVRKKIIMEPFPSETMVAQTETAVSGEPEPAQPVDAGKPAAAGGEEAPPETVVAASTEPAAVPAPVAPEVAGVPDIPAVPEVPDVSGEIQPPDALEGEVAQVEIGISGEDVGEPEPEAVEGEVEGLTLELAYAYNPAGKIDPFLPLVQESSDKGGPVVKKQRRSSRKHKTPLENFELSQLKLVAIMSTPNKMLAMVEEPNGKGYLVRAGTFIGPAEGKVVEIQKNKIVIDELHEDLMGKLSHRTREIELQKTAGE